MHVCMIILLIYCCSNFFVKEMLNEFSGLYAYHCPSNKWSLLRSSIDSSGDLRARMAHSMVFHPVCQFVPVHTLLLFIKQTSRKLYILGGQCGRDLFR